MKAENVAEIICVITFVRLPWKATYTLQTQKSFIAGFISTIKAIILIAKELSDSNINLFKHIQR